MKLQQMINRLGLGAVLASGSASAWAAEGGGLGDNLPVLGLAAALLIFAFTRKSEKSVPAAAPAPETTEAPAAAEAEAVAETVEGEAAETPVEATAEEAAPEADAESEQATSEEEKAG